MSTRLRSLVEYGELYLFLPAVKLVFNTIMLISAFHP